MRPKHWLQKTKVLELMWSQKHDFKALKVELLFNYKKKIRLKSLKTRL